MPNIINGMTAEKFIKDVNTYSIDSRGGFEYVEANDGKYPEGAFPVLDENGEDKMAVRNNNNIAEVKYLKSNDPNFLFPQVQEETEDWILVTDNYQNTGGKLFKRNTAWISKEHQDGLFFPMELRTNPRNSFKLVYDKPGDYEFTLPKWVSEYDYFLIDGGYHGCNTMYDVYQSGKYNYVNNSIIYIDKKYYHLTPRGYSSSTFEKKASNSWGIGRHMEHVPLFSFRVTVGESEQCKSIDPGTNILLNYHTTSDYLSHFISFNYEKRKIFLCTSPHTRSILQHNGASHSTSSSGQRYWDGSFYGNTFQYPKVSTDSFEGTEESNLFPPIEPKDWLYRPYEKNIISTTAGIYDPSFAEILNTGKLHAWTRYHFYYYLKYPDQESSVPDYGHYYLEYDIDKILQRSQAYGEDGIDVTFKPEEYESFQNTYNATPGADGAVILYF